MQSAKCAFCDGAAAAAAGIGDSRSLIYLYENSQSLDLYSGSDIIQMNYFLIFTDSFLDLFT